jgi:hypothetical protein
MTVIRKLSDRVEKEHNQFLRDSQRIEDRSATTTNGVNSGQTSRGGLDFETLVGGAGAGTIRADTELNLNWEDDVWGSILSSGTEVCFLLGPWKETADFCLHFRVHRRLRRFLKQLPFLQFPPPLSPHKASRRHHVSVAQDPLVLYHRSYQQTELAREVMCQGRHPSLFRLLQSPRT